MCFGQEADDSRSLNTERRGKGREKRTRSFLWNTCKYKCGAKHNTSMCHFWTEDKLKVS